MSGSSTLIAPFAAQPGSVRLRFPRSGARLHAMVASAGYDHPADTAYDWRGLERGGKPHVLLQHTLSGRGQLRYGTDRFTLLAGDTLLLRFPHDNRYWVEHGDRWEFFWLCLNGRETLRVWRDVMARHGPVVRLPPAALDRVAACVRTVMQGEAGSPASASAVAYGCAMALADGLLPWGEARDAGTPEKRIGRAVSLIHARPSARLDVGTLAGAAGYSRHHFSRLFEASEGVPPARYLARLRLDEAAAALRTTNKPVKTVARDCGFNDPSYFAKVFARSFGMTPKQYRAG